MNDSKWRLCVWVAIASLLLVPLASADSFLVGDAIGNLWEVALPSGHATKLGNMGTVMTDIALSPSGQLYGVSYTSLYTIDRHTGSSALVGSLGGPRGVNSLIFDGNGELLAADRVSQCLYKVNPLTAGSTIIGHTGFSSEGDLAFDSAGNLFLTATGGLVGLDRNTGAGRLIGPIGVQNIYGLVWLSGNMYGISDRGSVLRINPATGANEATIATIPLLAAFGATTWPEAPGPVPEPASAVLLGSALIALGAALKRYSLR
jgi:hypothetical protein